MTPHDKITLLHEFMDRRKDSTDPYHIEECAKFQAQIDEIMNKQTGE